MSEHEKFAGRLSIKEKEAKLLALRINGLLFGLRDIADPTLPTFKLKGELIGEQGVMIAALHSDYVAKLAEIDLIKEMMFR